MDGWMGTFSRTWQSVGIWATGTPSTWLRVLSVLAVKAWELGVMLLWNKLYQGSFCACTQQMRNAPLYCNVVPHWLRTYTKWSLLYSLEVGNPLVSGIGVSSSHGDNALCLCLNIVSLHFFRVCTRSSFPCTRAAEAADVPWSQLHPWYRSRYPTRV